MVEDAYKLHFNAYVSSVYSIYLYLIDFSFYSRSVNKEIIHGCVPVNYV